MCLPDGANCNMLSSKTLTHWVQIAIVSRRIKETIHISWFNQLPVVKLVGEILQVVDQLQAYNFETQLPEVNGLVCL